MRRHRQAAQPKCTRASCGGFVGNVLKNGISCSIPPALFQLSLPHRDHADFSECPPRSALQTLDEKVPRPRAGSHPASCGSPGRARGIAGWMLMVGPTSKQNATALVGAPCRSAVS